MLCSGMQVVRYLPEFRYFDRPKVDFRFPGFCPLSISLQFLTPTNPKTYGRLLARAVFCSFFCSCLPSTFPVLRIFRYYRKIFLAFLYVGIVKFTTIGYVLLTMTRILTSRFTRIPTPRPSSVPSW